MALTRVQSKASSSAADPGTATFDSTPAVGNLLVAIGFERSGNSMAIGTATISGSGWTQVIGRDTELANASFRRAYCVWWKIAGAAEPTTITIDNGSTSGKSILLQEFNDSSAGTWAFSEKADNDNGTTSSATSIGTGTTASTSGTQLVVSMLIARNAGGASMAGGTSFTNAATVVECALGSNSAYIAAGFFESSVTGTKTDTATCSSNNAGLSSGIAVFTTTGTPVVAGPKTLNNFMFTKTGSGMWSSERIR